MTTTTQSAPDAPRYALAWVIATCVLAMLTLGYPALGGGFLVPPESDQYIGGFPVRDFAAQSLKAGQGIPQWNPYIFGGMPYVAAMGVGDIFYPTQLLRLLLPVDVGMTWGFMIHIVLAGVFTFLFCRAMGLGFFASLTGGVAYMMSGPIAGLVSPGHDGKLFVSALLPLTLFLLTRGVRDGAAWAWGALALTVGLAVLSPHPQLLQYLLLTSGFFGLYLAYWSGDTAPGRKEGTKRLAYALGAVALGFLIGAIQYTPFIEYIPFSPRAAGNVADAASRWDHAISYSMPPEELLITTLLPEFSGILQKYWGRNGIHFHSEYVGPAVFMLAIAAVGATGGAMAMTRRFKIFMLGVLVVTAFWAMGGFTPFYQLVYYLVPGTKYFRAPSTIMYVTMFAGAVFAAIGVQRILSGQGPSMRLLAIGGGVVGLFALLGLTGGFTNLGVSIVGPGVLSSGVPLADRVMDNAADVRFGSVRMLFFGLLTLGVLLGVSRGILTGRWAGIALLLVVVADLWSVERKYWRFVAPASVTYASDGAIDYLTSRHDSARVLTLAAGNIAWHDPMISGDGLMVHNVRQAQGYHGNQLHRYNELSAPLIGVDQEAQMYVTAPNILSLLNVKYLLTGLPPGHPHLKAFNVDDSLVAGPARNAPGSMVYLYRLPGENPPAFVAATAFKVADDAALATLHDPRFNAEMHRRVAFVDTNSTTPTVADLRTLPPPSPVMASVQRPNHGRIVVELSAPAQDGNMLVVSENWYPGWTATIDGKTATVERADYTLLGVPLSAGARKVELQFTSPAYQRGRLITWAAVIVAVALCLAGFVLGSGRNVGWGRMPAEGAA